MAEQNKPECTVRGLIKPNAMCGYVIVGGKYCGFKGDCPHKSCAQMIVDREGQREMTELDQYKAHVAVLTECLQTFIDEHEECTDADDWMASMCSLEAIHVAEEALASTPSESYEEVKKLRDEIAKLQAERDALKKDAEWKPIETAPKDGSEILLCGKKGRIANGVWMTATDRVGAWLWPYIKVEPTHWMPLPAPPSGQARKGE